MLQRQMLQVGTGFVIFRAKSPLGLTERNGAARRDVQCLQISRL